MANLLSLLKEGNRLQNIKTIGERSRTFCCLLSVLWYNGAYMSPLGIKRTVAVLLIISPWIFIPGVFKDVVFIIAGVLLYISTLDLRKKVVHGDHQETESNPTNSHIVNA